jgi:type IV secretion system protein VirD4
MSFLSLYRDPLIARNVSRSDFAIRDLMNHIRPVTLYLIVRAEDKDRLKPLMRLIINQMMRVLLRPEITYEDGRPKMPHKHRLLLMLDEFPSYGKLEVFQEALAYIAGYGIKAYLIMQDIAQLWGAYGRDESIISNCHLRVAYAPNKIETAEWLFFEAPRQSQQAWFISRLGADANFANIAAGDVIGLETLRRGLRGDTAQLAIGQIQRQGRAG